MRLVGAVSLQQTNSSVVGDVFVLFLLLLLLVLFQKFCDGWRCGWVGWWVACLLCKIRPSLGSLVR